MPPKTKPSSADWENQKEAIRRLYLGQDLPLQKVRTQLEDNGFTATKAQYEAKFKEWGFSKNVPVNIWKHVGFKIGKRKREGKESAVSINGIEIPIKRVRKEISRHYYSVIERAEFEKINAPSPPGSLAVVSTPPSQQEVLIIERWPSNLPWFSFIRFLDTRLEGLPRMQLNPQTFQGGLPSTQKRLQANTTHGEQALRRTFSGSQQLVFDTIKEYAPSDLNHALLPFSSDVEWPADINSNMSLESTSSNHWGLKMLIYLASNKLLESSDVDAIWKMIENTGINQLANFSNASVWKNTSLEAAMEYLFETGIHQGHVRLVQWLLDSGMEPTTKLKLESAETEAHLPLIVALSSSHWEAWKIVRLLLSKGSSPVLICCEKHGSPIQFLIGSWKQAEDLNSPHWEFRKSFWDVFSKIMETLNQHPELQSLRYGDDFNVDLSALWHDLIEEDSDMDQEEDYEITYTYNLIELVEAVATKISNTGASVITPTVLIRAAENFNDGLIRFMHKCGQEMDCCDGHGRSPLLATLELSELDDYFYPAKIYISNVKRLLELGASADYIPPSQVHVGCSPALSVAVHNAANRVDTSEVVELLVRKGAHAQGLPSCGEKGHLSLADCARSQQKRDPRKLTEALISLHHAGLPLPEWSLISVLDLAYRNDEVEDKDKLCVCFTMLFETSAEICSNLSLRSEFGWTALQYAVHMRMERLAKLLVEHGATDMPRPTYLHLLARFFSPDAVKSIVSKLQKPRGIEHSRDLEFHKLIGIMHIARATNQDWQKFLNLICQYCKMSRNSEQEAYVIYTACSIGQAKLITTAMDMLPDTYSSAALGRLVRSRTLDVNDRWIFIHKLLHRRPRTSLGWITEIRMFIIVIDEALKAGGDGRVLEWLIAHDGNVFENANLHSSKFALQFFARRSIIEKRHVDEYATKWLNWGLKASSYFGVMTACIGQVETMGPLLDHGFQSNRRLCWSPTVLQIAVARGDKPMTLRLLDAGCNVNARPPWRDIPESIHKKMQKDILKVLTSHKEQTRRRTALQLAVEEGNLPFIKILLDFKADVNGRPARVGGATALQIACIKGYIEIARLLISKGAVVNAPGAEYFGRTALEGAAENGRLDIVGLLFEHGCRVDGRFRREYIRAVGFAKAQGNHALSKFLQDFGEWKKADEDCLREIDLKDEEPHSRDLEEDLEEDDDISEVDAAEFDYDINYAFPYEPGH